MPTVLLPVPHRSQSYEATCLASSVEMVLAYLGRRTTEKHLNHLFGSSVMDGTPFSRVVRVERMGFRVEYIQLDENDVRRRIHSQQPIITPLWTQMLPYWTYPTAHVAVVVGYDDQRVYLNDPAFPEAPQSVLWDGFLAAWEEYDRMAAIIRPSVK